MDIGDRFFAEFNPPEQNRQDMNPEAIAQIGLSCEWYVAWKIETGRYKGQFAITPLVAGVNLGWVLLSDLKIPEMSCL